MIAGNDEMGEVLAYATEGTLDTLSANVGAKLLLASYKQTFEILRQVKKLPTANTRASRQIEPVNPLLKSNWGQSYPFNAQTGHPYSGCVATAVAQIMFYHQWPAQGRGQHTYRVNYYNETKSADFSQSHYNWTAMLPDYRYPVHATTEQEIAVAQLMSDVGIAVNMQYTPNSSGAQSYTAFKALQTYFDYTAAFVTRLIEGPTRFTEILRQELRNGCPVYLEGSPAGKGSGHAWVTDGFDKNGHFHMNFGWDGQSNGYYSLSTLNITQTGNEFQGKPLAFNRSIAAILAHPNNAKYPDIERGLVASDPQLAFNGAGYLSLGIADKIFNVKETLTTEMSSFVNRGAPFKGDIGLAVFDEKGKARLVTYSDNHADGGFSQREYGAQDNGLMGTDYLMNRPQHIKLSLPELEDGYYRIVPICTARKDDGSWDTYVKMKKAPIAEIELTGGKARIAEENNEQAHFQLINEPLIEDKAEQGKKVNVVLNIKNLSGLPRDCYAHLQLLDVNNTVAFEMRNSQITEFEGFAETDVPFVLSLPADLPPARYKIRLEMEKNYEPTVRYAVNNIHDKDAVYIEVVKPTEKPLMAEVEPFLADDANTRVISNSIDITVVRNFKIGVSLRTANDREYEGPVRFYCEDILTKARIKLNGYEDAINVYPNFSVPTYSHWLRRDNLQLAENRVYRVVIMGKIGDKEIELSNEQRSYFLTLKGNILTLSTETTTDIEPTPAATDRPSIGIEADRVRIVGDNLQTVVLYTAAGMLVQRIDVQGSHTVELPIGTLTKGMYIVSVQSRKATATTKIQIK